jgi:hypothetical protein
VFFVNKSFVEKSAKFVVGVGLGLSFGLLAGFSSDAGTETLVLPSGEVLEDFRFESGSGDTAKLVGESSSDEVVEGFDPKVRFPGLAEGDEIPDGLEGNVLSRSEIDVEKDLGGDLNAMPNDRRSGGGANNADSVRVEGKVADFSEADLKNAFKWSTDMVGYGYSYSGFWNQDGGSFDPGAYWVYSGFVVPKVWEDVVVPKLIGQEELDKNKEFFDKFAPRAPKVKGVWASPAVGGFEFSEPVFGAGSKNGELVVEFSYKANAVYNDAAGKKFWSVPVDGKVKFVVVRGQTPAISDGKWLLSDWSGSSVPSFGTPKELGFVPNDRLPGFASEDNGGTPEWVELSPQQIKEIDELNRELYGGR